MVLGLELHYLEPQRGQTIRPGRGASGQHQIGFERKNRLNLRVQPTAKLRQSAHRGRKIRVAVHADQVLAAAQCTHRLSQ